MAKPSDVRMPADWNDHAGWDRYFAAKLAAPPDPLDDFFGSIPTPHLLQLTEQCLAQGWRAVWVPGCGIAPLPRLLAYRGLDVVATDVSPTAVEFQARAADRLDSPVADLGPRVPGGSLRAELHDFRTGFRAEAFDLILNMKAFQAFPVEDMRRIAAVHAGALKPGRTAYFDTMNVQGERRDVLEQALADGGFHVPLLALEQWYRRTLRETGIPFVFILGRPRIPHYHIEGYDQSRRAEDEVRLQAIHQEYESRIRAESEAEQSRVGLRTKTAVVIYNTG